LVVKVALLLHGAAVVVEVATTAEEVDPREQIMAQDGQQVVEAVLHTQTL
jgi:hypothetical protein